MKDEIFRLTPLDVRRMEFPKGLRGYDAARVDDFREQVAEELERLTRANQELESNVRSLTEQLRGFRDRDKALNEALVSAQQLRSESREQSEREAQLILREARSEADRIVQVAQMDAMRSSDQIALLARMRRGEVAPDPTTKKCPECLSDVPIAARRCAFCTSLLTEAAAR